MTVFVLDARHQPLMPGTEKRARLLLRRGRAVVHRVVPFCSRLKDRRVETSTLQPVVLKGDAGSRTTGLALVRSERTAAGEGEVHHALQLIHLEHRGQQVHAQLGQRAGYGRRRRSATRRHRPRRVANRQRPAGWLPPSLRSRIDNVLIWTRRFQGLVPLTRLDIERVTFATALLQHPERRGVAYQRGELVGWERRAYLLEQFGRRCVSCKQTHVPFQLDHVLPRSRGGSDRVSNLALACGACNHAKDERTAAEFGHPEVQAHAHAPWKDAAAVNATRYALCDALRARGLPLTTWSGGRTRWNRDRFALPKDHALDALCVGDLAGVSAAAGRPLRISATGRGSSQRTKVDAAGFPRGYLTRQKRVRGFQTGDLVRAEVPPSLKTAGVQVGRVAVRSTGSFRVGKTDGINAQDCRVVQRADGYAYLVLTDEGGGASSPP